MQTGTNSSSAATDPASEQAVTFHVWLSSPVEGRIDLTEEQVDEFLPGVRYAEGRATARPSRLFLHGRYGLPAPLDRYRVSEQYLPVLDRALVELGVVRSRVLPSLR